MKKIKNRPKIKKIQKNIKLFKIKEYPKILFKFNK